MLDHGKTWNIRTSLAPEAAVGAFLEALGGSARMGLMKAEWSVDRKVGGDGRRAIIATYKGRAGLSAFVTSLSQRSTDEGEAAVGSQITFEAKPHGQGGSECTMWLSSATKVMLVFTADSRFFRAYMSKAADAIKRQDPGALISKT